MVCMKLLRKCREQMLVVKLYGSTYILHKIGPNSSHRPQYASILEPSSPLWGLAPLRLTQTKYHEKQHEN